MLDKAIKIIAEHGMENIDLVAILASELAGIQLPDNQDNINVPDQSVPPPTTDTESM